MMPSLRLAISVTVSVLAAGSCVPSDDPEPGGPNSVVTTGLLHNGTLHPLRLRMRQLASSVQIECATVALDPGGFLTSRLFDGGSVVTLEPDAVLPLGDFAESSVRGAAPMRCTALRLEHDDIAPVVVFWREGELQPVEVPSFGLDRSVPGWIDFTRVQQRLTWQSEPPVAFSDHPVELPSDEICRPREDRTRLAWTTPVPAGAHWIDALEVTTDACVALQLREPEASVPRRWFFCGPPDTFPFAVGDLVRIDVVAETGVELRRLDPESMSPMPGAPSLYASRGGAVPFLDFTVSTMPSSCAFHVDACGTVARTLGVALESPTRGTKTLPWPSTRPVEFEASDGSSVSISWVRGQERTVVDETCGLGPTQLGPDLEFVAVHWPAPS